MKSIWTAAAVIACAMVPCNALAASEPRTTDEGAAERWTAPGVVVVLDPSLEDLAPGATDAVRQAVGTWVFQVAGLPNVVFDDGDARIGSARDGKSVISAGPITLAGHEKDLALTTTYADDATGAILEADVVFNTRYAWAVMPAPAAGCSKVFDVGAAATHESGHFFGLGEDWVDETTTMYVITDPCDVHKRTLTPEDTQAIGALYAPPTSMTASCDAAPAPAGRGALATTFVGLALALVTRRMRRA